MEAAMIVTVFRSRLKPGVLDEYVAMANRMNEIVKTMPGYISDTDFIAEDGERVTVVEFESEEALRAWRRHPEHIMAQEKARAVYFSSYRIQVCELLREAAFAAAD
jgi:heme-degrading monooxygenase HmoA